MQSAKATSTERSRPVRVVLALGSNVGDRRYELELAIRALRRHVDIVRRSPIHETAPVDSPEGAGPFLNMVVAGFTTLGPHQLLELIHSHEKTRGRRRIVRNEPRRIDVDIIQYGAARIFERNLVIPHPRFSEREFVVVPMSELGLYRGIRDQGSGIRG
ncbi:MAG: 2-amino-4-hydroxy-6-hydroxymethyldihydropteridine diphosphokinase [Acidobacteria bacterium]|nr:2-amino-4-hydroxy-6-hydroxymethyldihydropteridine diphosphokinase [Acidobacteriota bacterium]